MCSKGGTFVKVLRIFEKNILSTYFCLKKGIPNIETVEESKLPFSGKALPIFHMKFHSKSFLGHFFIVFFLGACNLDKDSTAPLSHSPLQTCNDYFLAGRDDEAIQCFENALDTLDAGSSKGLSYLYSISQSYRYKREFEQALEPLTRFDSLYQIILAEGEGKLWGNVLLKARRLSLEGYLYDNLQKTDLSQEYFSHAESLFYPLLDSLSQIDSIDTQPLLTLCDNLSSHYSLRAWPDSAVKYKKIALRTLLQSEEPNNKEAQRLLKEIYVIYDYLVELDSLKKYADLRLAFLDQVYEGDTVEEVVQCFPVLAQYHIFHNEYETAIDYLQKAQSWSKNHTSSRSFKLDYFTDLHYGDIYLKIGDYPRAIDSYRRALGDADSLPVFMANIYEKFSEVYLHMGDLPEALEASRMALLNRNFSSKIPDTQQRIINSLLSKAHIYLEWGQLDSANAELSHAQSMFDKMEQVSRTTNRYQAKFLQTQGAVYQSLGKYNAAQKSLLDAINKYQTLYGDKHEELGSTFLLMGETALLRKNWNRALAYADQALDAIIVSFSPASLVDMSETATINELVLSYAVLARAFDLKAQVFRKRFLQEKDIQWLYQALEQYREADKYLSSNLSQLATESSVMVFRNSWYFLYEEVIKTCLQIWQEDQNSKGLSWAYTFAEKSKAHLLRQNQQDLVAKTKSGLDSTLWARERTLKREVAFTRAALIQATKPDQDSLNEVLSEKMERYMKLVAKLKKENSQYYEYKYELPISSISEIQGTLSANQVFVQYFEGDSTLFQFVILKDNSWINKIPKDTSLEATIDNFQKLVSRKPINAEAYQTAWQQYGHLAYELYQILYQPIAQHFKGDTDLIIVADGILMKLPTGALLTQAQFENPLNPPFFLHDVATSYEFSGTTRVSNFRNSSSNSLEILGVTPDFSEVELVNLDRTTEGLRKIKQRVSGKFLEDRKATKANVMKHIQEYGILYFATHAQMDTTSPLFSNLAFTPESAPMEKDRDFLYAYELYNYSLKAQLTILGACETGIGAYERSEGMISLGRAFAYAGCPSLVMSLWKAQYITTSLDILPGFVENLAKKHNKAKALQEAKIEFLKKAQEKGWREDLFPYAWATFISVGDQSPLNLAEPD